MRYGILSLTVCLCAAWAQDPATLDKITSTINAKVTSAAAREHCICELQPDLWGNVNGQVLVDKSITSDGANHVFRITAGLFYDEISSDRPSGLVDSKRSAIVAIPSSDIAFQRGAPFFISNPSLDSTAKNLRYTLLSNPAINLNSVYARYQEINSFFTFEVIGSNQPFSSSANPQNLTWQFNAPIVAATDKTERFSMVIYGPVGGSNTRCLESNEIDLQALLPPVVAAVVNNASGQQGISSGSWVSIYGTNLSGTTRGWQDSDFSGKNLPLALDGVSVKINGKSAPVNYVSPGQLNVQAPTDDATGPVQVVVTNSLGSVTGNATLQKYAPGFFTFKNKYAAAVHTDGAYVAPAGFFGDTVASRPAEPNEVIEIFGTGFGPTTPPVPAGVIVSESAPITDLSLLGLTIGGVTATVQYAGIVAAGEYQFNVVVPQVQDGDQSIMATIGGVSTQTGISITVKQQPKPQAQYPGSTQEAALACPSSPGRMICIGSVTASPGEQLDFWVAGTDLASVTGIQFLPLDGIDVSQIQTTNTMVHALLKISPNASQGKRMFFLKSLAGDSNQSPGPLNISTFRISNLRVGPASNTNNTLTFPVTLDYTDPTGAVSSGFLDITTALAFGSTTIFGVGGSINPSGRNEGATSGSMSFTRSYNNISGTTGAFFSVQLGASDGRSSDKLQAAF